MFEFHSRFDDWHPFEAEVERWWKMTAVVLLCMTSKLYIGKEVTQPILCTEIAPGSCVIGASPVRFKIATFHVNRLFPFPWFQICSTCKVFGFPATQWKATNNYQYKKKYNVSAKLPRTGDAYLAIFHDNFPSICWQEISLAIEVNPTSCMTYVSTAWMPSQICFSYMFHPSATG